MRRVRVLLLGFGLVACSGNLELQKQQSLWNQQGIAHYRYTVQTSCFCGPDLTQPLRVEVKNGKAVALTNAETGLAVSDSRFEPINTIDKLYALIRAAIVKPVASIKVEYDASLGIPTSIVIDNIANAADDEVSYSVRDFEVVL